MIPLVTCVEEVLAVKELVEQCKAECDELAEKALACNTAAEVKALLESAAR